MKRRLILALLMGMAPAGLMAQPHSIGVHSRQQTFHDRTPRIHDRSPRLHNSNGGTRA